MNQKHNHIPPNNENFEAPEGYFEGLEQALFEKITQKGYILESNIDFPFTAPEGYFAQLEEDVFDQTIRIKPTLKISHKRNFAPWYRIAAALIVAGAFSFWYLGQSKTSTQVALSEISNEDILAYLGEQNLNSEVIYSYLPEEKSRNLDKVNEEEILDYIDVDLLNDI